jgi:hypothetical protein
VRKLKLKKKLKNSDLGLKPKPPRLKMASPWCQTKTEIIKNKHNIVIIFQNYAKFYYVAMSNGDLNQKVGCAIAQEVSCWLPTAAAAFEAGCGHVGFVMDKMALGQVFSEYFSFPCQSSFHQLPHNHPHLSSGACTMDQTWPQYLVDLVPPH